MQLGRLQTSGWTLNLGCMVRTVPVVRSFIEQIWIPLFSRAGTRRVTRGQFVKVLRSYYSIGMVALSRVWIVWVTIIAPVTMKLV